jgi:ABC-type transport system involved in cytochrome c biogenesis permease subunit
MAKIPSDASSSAHHQAQPNAVAGLARGVLDVLGSLKLTVVLFAISLIIVLVGTLAQDEMNMLEVKQRYFLSWFTFLYLDDFFPQAFFPHTRTIPFRIPFIGGAMIGVLLMINLVTAKVTRFKIHAHGGRLAAGIGFIVAGFAAAGLIIQAGHSNEGLQGNPPLQYDRFWLLILAGLAALGVGSLVAALTSDHPRSRVAWIGLAVAVASFVSYSIANEWRIGDPGLRIVWQLTKGVGAGLILLVGCRLVFDKQGGNVLLHLGVALLMFGQFVFGDRQLEQRLNLIEGESTNSLVNYDAVELAFIEAGEDDKRVTAVPASQLVAAAEANSVIKDEALPVDIRVLEFLPNSNLEDVGATNSATDGLGLEIAARSVPKSGGADGGDINVASAYVELLDKESGESLGKYLASQWLSDRTVLFPDSGSGNMYDSIKLGDEELQVGLQFHREVKPYWIQLEDVRRVDYTGSDMVKDYSSFIRIVDTETGEDRKERVWMNNPLRYRGETFYQSNYHTLASGKEMTGIQVVRNSGWLIPYVACGITALGMLAHFLGTLTRFLNRRQREVNKRREELAEFNVKPPTRLPIYLTVLGFATLAGVMLVPWTAVFNAARPQARAEKFDFYTAGKIPVQFGGRMMPLDAYARQTLKAMSNKESLPLDEDVREMLADKKSELQLPENGSSGLEQRAKGSRLSALQWLMEVAVSEPQMRYLPMLRIDASEIRSELDLERRESKLYSIDEIYEPWIAAEKQVDAARAKATNDAKSLTFKEKKLLELHSRISAFTRTKSAMEVPTVPEIPKDAFPGMDEEMLQQIAERQLEELERRMEAFDRFPAPAIIPPTQADAESSEAAATMPKWSSFGPAFFMNFAEAGRSDDPEQVTARPGIEAFSDMISAYADQDTEAFNKAVDDHLTDVHAYPVPRYNRSLVNMERWMQSNWPTGVAMVLYLVTLVMGLVYFAVGLPRLRQAVWGTLAIAMIVHTIAIVCRIMITQRAPVINIYSSAVFIGWGAVLFGLVVERIFRNGMGNMLSATAGVLTLLVAYGLNTGDTMPVLQAVLDTQFWLATHVISVTLGYVATLVAGTLGIGYLIAGWLNKDKAMMRDLYRCCYGAACFGILFSFVGTVLGGLWADDSWGRFWGWDPKENGALLIVIWNALVLHARWDGMVKARGFAILAIFGNVVTAWSWFGTNELGIGLHSYGFTSGVLMWLSVFVFTQAAFILLGLLFWPRSEQEVAT